MAGPAEMLNPWAQASWDPKWNPSLYEVARGHHMSNTDAWRNLYAFSGPGKEPVVVHIADVYQPYRLDELGEAPDTPSSITLLPSTDARMPQVRGRLSVMTSALNDRFPRELCSIDTTKAYIEEVLASDSRQLFLRGILLNDSEMASSTRPYWMDTWDSWYQQQKEREPSNHSEQLLRAQVVDDAEQMPLDATNPQQPTEARTEPSSEIDLQHLGAYKPSDEGQLSTQVPIQHLDSSPGPTIDATPSHQQFCDKQDSTVSANAPIKSDTDTKEQPHRPSKQTEPTLPAYRTGRRRMLLHSLHRQRRALSDRLDQTEKELETYGAMRNMEHVWSAAPKFECKELDDLIDTISVKISKEKESHAAQAKPLSIMSDKGIHPSEEKEDHAPQVNPHVIEADNGIQPDASAHDSVPQGDSEPELSHNERMMKYARLALRIDEVREQAQQNETRALALARAVALPRAQDTHEDSAKGVPTKEGRKGSQASSISTENISDESRRPSTATDVSMFQNHRDATAEADVAANKITKINEIAALVGLDTCNIPQESAQAPHPTHASELPANSRDGHQSQSSTSTIASERSAASGASSHLSHISRVGTDNVENDTTPQAHDAPTHPSQSSPMQHPDEETRKLLRFRRELLREWHIWDHVQQCLSKRTEAIHRERTRLRHYVALVRATRREKEGSQHDGAYASSTPSSLNTSSPMLQSDAHPDDLLARQRARARQLGFAPGVRVLNPDTPTDAGAYVWIPSDKHDYSSPSGGS